MARRGRQSVEANGALCVEGDCAPPGEVERFRLAHPRDKRFGRVGIDGLRPFAAQAKDHRLVGRVALPVKASEPTAQRRRVATRSIAPVATSPPANAAAAFIGPTVCDDDGPMPILNSSKTLIIARPRAAAGFRSGSRRILAQFDRGAAIAAQHEALPFGPGGRLFHLCANGRIGCLVGKTRGSDKAQPTRPASASTERSTNLPPPLPSSPAPLFTRPRQPPPRFSPDCSPNLFDELRRDLVDLFPVLSLRRLRREPAKKCCWNIWTARRSACCNGRSRPRDSRCPAGRPEARRSARRSQSAARAWRAAVRREPVGGRSGQSPPHFRDPSASPGISTLWGASHSEETAVHVEVRRSSTWDQAKPSFLKQGPVKVEARTIPPGQPRV